MSNNSRLSLVDQRVEFKISDVYIPDPQEVVWKMCSDNVLQGRVVYQTDNTDEEQFVAVEVEGFQERVFVPVRRLHCL